MLTSILRLLLRVELRVSRRVVTGLLRLLLLVFALPVAVRETTRSPRLRTLTIGGNTIVLRTLIRPRTPFTGERDRGRRRSC